MARTFFPVPPSPSRDPIADGTGMISRIWEVWLDRLRELTRKSEAFSVSWTPAAVAANTAAEQTVTVTGALTSMTVSVTPPGITAGVAPVCARVSAANTVAVTFVNPTAGSLTPPAGTYIFETNQP